MKNYIAAVAVDLYIGDFRFDAIQVVETGEYRMAQKQALENAGENKNWLTRLQSAMPDAHKKLVAQGFDQVTVAVRYSVVGKNGRKVTVTAESLSLTGVRVLWRFLDKEYNKPQASRLIDALTDDSLRDRFDQVYGKERASQEQRRENDNRILDKRCPWEKLYDKAMCDKGFGWFGSQFYWDYFYFWMTPDERCKLNVVNPLVKGKRKDKIHQWIEPETKERLKPRALEMCLLVSMSANKEQFERHYRSAYGQGWQQEMF